MGISHETYRTIVAVVDDRVKEIKVTRKDFNDLKTAVESLAEAQKRTEEKLGSLAGKVERLAGKVESLAGKLESLTGKVESLAEAQQRTEAKLEALIDTVYTMHEDLSNQIKGLDRRVEKIEKVVGGISNTLGYALENEVYRHLPMLLEKRYGIRVEERFIRREMTFDDNKKGEINIFGKGTKDGKMVLILGEVESKLGTDTINELVSKSSNLKRSFPHDHFLLAATHYCRPEVADHAAGRGVAVVMTYELM